MVFGGNRKTREHSNRKEQNRNRNRCRIETSFAPSSWPLKLDTYESTVSQRAVPSSSPSTTRDNSPCDSRKCLPTNL